MLCLQNCQRKRLSVHVKQSGQLGEVNLVNVQAVIHICTMQVVEMESTGSNPRREAFLFLLFFFNIIKPGKIQIEHEGVSNDRFNLHSFKVKKKPGFKNCMWWASSYASISQKPQVPMPIRWTCFLNC